MINHPQVITIFMGRIHRQMVGLALGFSHDLIQEPSRRAGQASTIWTGFFGEGWLRLKPHAMIPGVFQTIRQVVF